MGNTWKHILKITEEEEAPFDTVHAPHIETHININTNKIEPYQVSVLSRLDGNCFCTRPISTEALKRYCKRTKNNAVATSKINKAVLEKSTNKLWAC